MMAVDPFGGMNLSSAFNNSRIERDTETYIFEFESLSDMNYARYGAGYATDNEYIYAFGGADSEGVHNHGERYDPDTDTWEIFGEDFSLGIRQDDTRRKFFLIHFLANTLHNTNIF